MRTYILKWNPAISSTSMQDMEDILWEADDIYLGFNWSIFDWQEAERGDRFYMLRVGRGKVGILASGWFTTNPYEGEDWSDPNGKRHYVNLTFDTLIRPRRSLILETKRLQEAIPNVDWKHGHSGVLIDEADAETLHNLWQSFIKENPKQFSVESYAAFHSHTNQAFGIAINAHKHQVDKAGNDYLKSHILGVYDRVDHIEDSECNPVSEVVALLHDVVEDSDWTIEQLRSYGFTEEMLTALQCVTKQEGETYDHFIERAIPNDIARAVKIADLKSNMDITRLNEITDTDVERLRKYHKAYKKLIAFKKEEEA